jgi:hypothetical protein
LLPTRGSIEDDAVAPLCLYTTPAPRFPAHNYHLQSHAPLQYPSTILLFFRNLRSSTSSSSYSSSPSNLTNTRPSQTLTNHNLLLTLSIPAHATADSPLLSPRLPLPLSLLLHAPIYITSQQSQTLPNPRREVVRNRSPPSRAPAPPPTRIAIGESREEDGMCELRFSMRESAGPRWRWRGRAASLPSQLAMARGSAWCSALFSLSHTCSSRALPLLSLGFSAQLLPSESDPFLDSGGRAVAGREISRAHGGGRRCRAGVSNVRRASLWSTNYG